MAKLLVTTACNPDFDDFASAYAYSKLLEIMKQENTLAYYGNMQADVNFMINKLGIKDFQKDIQGEFEEVILLDDASPEKIPSIVEKEKVIEVIDHHDHELSEIYPNAKVQIEKVGACSTLVAEKWMEEGLVPDDISANLMYYAILASTYNLKSLKTHLKDHQASDWLSLEFDFDPDFVYEIFKNRTEFTLTNLENVLEDDSKTADTEFGKILICQLEVNGLEELIRDKKAKIMGICERLVSKFECKEYFVSCIDLEKEKTAIICPDLELQIFLTKKLGYVFSEDTVWVDEMVMRKHVIRKLKD